MPERVALAWNDRFKLYCLTSADGLSATDDRSSGLTRGLDHGEQMGCHFLGTDFPTHELDASAALGGAGVALLSPILFASLLA